MPLSDDHPFFRNVFSDTKQPDYEFIDFLKKMLCVNCPTTLEPKHEGMAALDYTEDTYKEFPPDERWSAAQLMAHPFLVNQQKKMIEDMLIGNFKNKNANVDDLHNLKRNLAYECFANLRDKSNRDMHCNDINFN